MHLLRDASGEDTIREAAVFPKNNKATDPMTQAPSVVSEKQLDELNLQVEVAEQEIGTREKRESLESVTLRFSFSSNR